MNYKLIILVRVHNFLEMKNTLTELSANNIKYTNHAYLNEIYIKNLIIKFIIIPLGSDKIKDTKHFNCDGSIGFPKGETNLMTKGQNKCEDYNKLIDYILESV